MSQVTVETLMSYTTKVDEDEVEAFLTGFHVIMELPNDIILEEAWVYPGDGEEINATDLIKEIWP